MSAYTNLHYLRWLHLLFLAAQFGSWIWMVEHSIGFDFSVSGFVSFSQFQFSYFAYVSKNLYRKTVGSEFDNPGLFAILRATDR